MAILSKEEIIKQIDPFLEDIEYKISRARSPKKKREHKGAQEFFASIKHHLSIQIDQDEAIQEMMKKGICPNCKTDKEVHEVNMNFQCLECGTSWC